MSPESSSVASSSFTRDTWHRNYVVALSHCDIQVRFVAHLNHLNVENIMLKQFCCLLCCLAIVSALSLRARQSQPPQSSRQRRMPALRRKIRQDRLLQPAHEGPQNFR